jgi:PAS domain S-box-containing protein
MRLALRVAGAYAILSAIWILFSDLAVARLFPQEISEIQLVKGWLFVLVSAGLIFILILYHDRQRRRLDLALETHPSGILITDTHLRITYANSSISRISGFQREDLIGQKPSILGSGLTPLPVFEAMHRDIDHGESWAGEFLNRRKSGELYWAAATIIPLRDGRGRIMSYVGTMADISNEKRTQSAMLEAKNMAEEANRSKSDFLANMSHELRTPLNAIVGFTDLLQRGYAGTLTESQKDYVNNIAHSSEHLLGLINSVLDLSRVELGHFRIELGEVEVNALICECLNMLDAIALKKGVIIHFEPCLETLVVSSDRQAIRQIVTNIVGNAVKFSPPGTRIGVKTDRRSNEFEIAVVDQGPGMSTEQIERVFEPFQSRAAHSAHQTEGTGLGLSICRKLIDLLDGRILLSSLEGHGTTVRIILPLLQPAERVH